VIKEQPGSVAELSQKRLLASFDESGGDGFSQDLANQFQDALRFSLSSPNSVQR